VLERAIAEIENDSRQLERIEITEDVIHSRLLPGGTPFSVWERRRWLRQMPLSFPKFGTIEGNAGFRLCSWGGICVKPLLGHDSRPSVG
jgi:hypothetical protein